MTRRNLSFSLLAAALATAVAAAAAAGHARPHKGASTPRLPPPASFSTRIDNRWFPLRPGTRYVYTGVKDRKPARELVTGTDRTRTIEEVPCGAGRNRLYLRVWVEGRPTDVFRQ